MCSPIQSLQNIDQQKKTCFKCDYRPYVLNAIFAQLSAGSICKRINPVLPGGEQNTPPPPPVFLHHPKTAQGIKLKLSDFKDTPLRHILQVKPVR